MNQIITLMLVAAGLVSLPVAAAVPDFAHIETSGHGEVIARPDMAEFTVQAEESALTAEQAKKAVDSSVTAFISRLTEAGVSRDAIQSSNLYLAPKYQYPKSGQAELVGYQASRRITVTVYQLEKLNSYLDGALGDGIDRVDNIRLKVKDRQRYQEQARQEAIKDADSKARSLAQGFGGTLGGVWKVSYHSNPVRPVVMREMAMDVRAAGDTGYQDSTITISDSVNVVYRFSEN
jgi:uncharacterized protein YggE